MTQQGTHERVARALRELAAGRPVLLADDRAREDEVDVVLAAREVTAEWIAWTVRHSSGYLCAPMPAGLADRLELPLMVERSQDPRSTAYAISVDAARGVTTGISAADRATTLRALAAAGAVAADVIRPGHVLPLRAVPGGVLERPGHTEASLELVRAAGAGEVAVIAELVRDDGGMMRIEQAAELAAGHDLLLLHVADVIEWRRAAEERRDAATGSAGGSINASAGEARGEETSMRRAHGTGADETRGAGA